jgi:hypothetical protein
VLFNIFLLKTVVFWDKKDPLRGPFGMENSSTGDENAVIDQGF